MRRPNSRLCGSIAAAREVGISLRQLYYWVDTLRVVPPRLCRHGRREFHRFTPHDLKKLKHMRKQVERGYTLRAALGLIQGRRG